MLSFFSTYANIDKWQVQELKATTQLENPLDIWIISKLHSLLKQVKKEMDDYDLNRAVQPFLVFIDQLTNWYIRRSRRRFWKAEQGEDKQQAYLCLYEILSQLSKVLAPFIPFLADKIYQVIKNENAPVSVHLCSFPQPNESWIDEKLNNEMDKIIQLVSLGRQLRAKNGINLRQPLSKITLVSSDNDFKKVVQNMSELICEELNIKEVVFLENEAELIKLSARPNLPLLGPRYGKQMKQLTQAIKNLP